MLIKLKKIYLFYLKRRLTNRDIGALGELIGSQYLSGKGLKLIFKNLEFKRGEIDLIFYDHEEIVLVEVKTRLRFKNNLLLRDSITLRKEEILARHKKYFETRLIYKKNATRVRVDYLIILLERDLNLVSIDWYKDMLP